MLSFDAVSLFTNVPVDYTISVIIETIEQFHLPCRVPLNSLRSLLEMCVKNVQFLFDGKLYRQKDGVGMGSCLGVLFADVFVGKMEMELRDSITSQTIFYARYVDDCFLIVPHSSDVDKLLSDFN